MIKVGCTLQVLFARAEEEEEEVEVVESSQIR